MNEEQAMSVAGTVSGLQAAIWLLIAHLDKAGVIRAQDMASDLARQAAMPGQHPKAVETLLEIEALARLVGTSHS